MKEEVFDSLLVMTEYTLWTPCHCVLHDCFFVRITPLRRYHTIKAVYMGQQRITILM
jgi:hypothetical protein